MGTREERRGWLLKLAQGIKAVFAGDGARVEETEEPKLVLEKEFIEKALFHRGRALLLNKVVITMDKVWGEYTVTPEACEGHIIDGMAIFKGSDFIDMACQLVGVWYVSQHPELIGKTGFFREGQLKVSNISRVGDNLVIEIDSTKLRANSTTSKRGVFTNIRGEDFLVKSGTERRATVAYIEIISVEKPKVEPSTS